MICFIVIVVFPTNNVVKRYFILSSHIILISTLQGGLWVLEGEQMVKAHFIFRLENWFDCDTLHDRAECLCYRIPVLK